MTLIEASLNSALRVVNCSYDQLTDFLVQALKHGVVLDSIVNEANEPQILVDDFIRILSTYSEWLSDTRYLHSCTSVARLRVEWLKRSLKCTCLHGVLTSDVIHVLTDLSLVLMS